MLITDRFILINFPKTGSTFVRTVLQSLYSQRRANSSIFRRIARRLTSQNSLRLLELHVTNLHTSLAGGQLIKDQHGCFDQVPHEYQHLPVVSVARHPFDRYVSMYHFRWWADHPCAEPEELQRYFPEFPNLTFSRFIDYHNFRYRKLSEKYDLVGNIGPNTLQFVMMHFRNHEDVLRRWNSAYVATGQYKVDLPQIELLRNEHLNDDLCNLLLRYGFCDDEIDFIHSAKPIQPPEGTTRSPIDDWRKYFNSKLIARVHAEESDLFRIYKDLGVSYK